MQKIIVSIYIAVLLRPPPLLSINIVLKLFALQAKKVFLRHEPSALI